MPVEQLNNVLCCDCLPVELPFWLVVHLVKEHTPPSQAPQILAVAVWSQCAKQRTVAKLNKEFGGGRCVQALWVYKKNV